MADPKTILTAISIATSVTKITLDLFGIGKSSDDKFSKIEKSLAEVQTDLIFIKNEMEDLERVTEEILKEIEELNLRKDDDIIRDVNKNSNTLYDTIIDVRNISDDTAANIEIDAIAAVNSALSDIETIVAETHAETLLTAIVPAILNVINARLSVAENIDRDGIGQITVREDLRLAVNLLERIVSEEKDPFSREPLGYFEAAVERASAREIMGRFEYTGDPDSPDDDLEVIAARITTPFQEYIRVLGGKGFDEGDTITPIQAAKLNLQFLAGIEIIKPIYRFSEREAIGYVTGNFPFNVTTDVLRVPLLNHAREVTGIDQLDEVIETYRTLSFGVTNEGTIEDDTLQGTSASDLLIGSFGNDILRGSDGNDVLRGGDGDDELDGGNDNDRLSGEAGNDTLADGAGDDQVDGGAGDDTVLTTPGTGQDVLEGGDGNDTLVFSGDVGATISLAISGPQDTGGFGIDTISGFETVRGSGGDDVFVGSDGDDTIEGGGGADRLTGGSGQDTLVGGPGLDLFIDAAAHFDGDVIEDLELSERIVFEGVRFGEENVQVSPEGELITVDLDQDGTSDVGITLRNGADLDPSFLHVINSSSRTELFYLPPAMPVVDLARLDGGLGLAIKGVDGSTWPASGDNSGFTVSTAGDINSDGIDDLLIGARYAQSRSGEVYIVYGSTADLAGSIELAALEPENGAVLAGSAPGGAAGFSAAPAGDI